LLPDKISSVDPSGIGALFKRNTSVLLAGAPVFTPVVVSLDNITSAVTTELCIFVIIKPSTIAVVLLGQVYNVSGVPALAGITSCVITLKVFAIIYSYLVLCLSYDLFIRLICLNFIYPKAIAKAVASSTVAAAKYVLNTLASVLFSVPPSLINNSSVSAMPEASAV
jgi:hypothetical protein